VTKVELLEHREETFSENKLQRQLHDSRWSGTTDLSGNGIADDCVRNSEVSPVECVEHLPAEVQPQLFVDLEVPMNSQIDVETAGTYKNSAARIPKTELGGACKRGNIEAAVNGSIAVRQITIRETVWAISASAGRVGDCRSQRWSEVLSARQAPDSRQIPVAHDMRKQSRVDKLSFVAERQFVHVVDNRNVPPVLWHASPFAVVATGILRRTVATTVDVRTVGKKVGPGVGE